MISVIHSIFISVLYASRYWAILALYESLLFVTSSTLVSFLNAPLYLICLVSVIFSDTSFLDIGPMNVRCILLILGKSLLFLFP